MTFACSCSELSVLGSATGPLPAWAPERPGDPPRVLRGKELHNRANIIGLADPLERLHAENEGLALVGLDEVRHVGVDHARRDRVDADAARPERRREVL